MMACILFEFGLHYRAVSKPLGGDIIWSWIGNHAEYDKLLMMESGMDGTGKIRIKGHGSLILR